MVLIFNIIEDFGVLPYFLRYYSARGIYQFLCGLHEGSSNRHFSDIAGKLRAYPHKICMSYSAEFNGERDAESQNRQRECLRYEDWYCVADPDEFHYHRDFDNFDQMRVTAEKEGASYVPSPLVDRLPANGELVDIDPRLSLDEQFPLEARVTERAPDVCVSKIAMARSCLPIYPGRHEAPGKPASFFCRTHHFKRQGGSFSKLMLERLMAYQRQNLYYWQ